MLFLTACETDEDFWRPYRYVVGQTQAELGWRPRPRPHQTYVDRQCADVAQQRAEDATANGADEDTAKAIYAGAYTDCADWKKQHAL